MQEIELRHDLASNWLFVMTAEEFPKSRLPLEKVTSSGMIRVGHIDGCQWHDSLLRGWYKPELSQDGPERVIKITMLRRLTGTLMLAYIHIRNLDGPRLWVRPLLVSEDDPIHQPFGQYDARAGICEHRLIYAMDQQRGWAREVSKVFLQG